MKDVLKSLIVPCVIIGRGIFSWDLFHEEFF